MQAARFHVAWLLRWAWTRWREVRPWHGHRLPGAVGGWSLVGVSQGEHTVSSMVPQKPPSPECAREAGWQVG